MKNYLFILIVAHLVFVNAQEDPLSIYRQPKADEFTPKPNTKVCYDVVGCFDNNPPFNNSGLYLPVSPDLVDTKFRLFTSPQNEFQLVSYLDENRVRNSRFNKQYPLKVIIHGFQNTGEDKWVLDMVDNILTAEKNRVNVITVDWENGAVFPHYFNASANTRLVGRQTCLLVKAIRNVFYGNAWTSNLNVHCIGHSLGAQTCGYASADCDSMFDRISALDPAGPNFEGTDPKVRIDPSDAKFVDVIHSNGDNLLTGNFGMSSPCGHVDFYPNGGKQQPGCPGLFDLIGGLFSNPTGAINGVSCSHGRAIDYFSESIVSSCSFSGFPCDNIDSFERGNCLDCSAGGCSSMGYYSSSTSRGIKYLLTPSKGPFCANPHLSELFVSSSNVKTAGEVGLVFESGSTSQTILLTKRSDELLAGQVLKKVFVTDIDVRFVEKSSINFNKKPKPLFGSDPYGPKLTINKLKVTNLVLENEVFSDCTNNLEIADKQVVTLNLRPNDCQLVAKENTLTKLFNLIKSYNL